MKVGDYVRTKCYGIQRITGFISDLENDYIDCDYDEITRCLINKKEIIKSSPNIIDLIEVGDIIKKTYKTGLIERIPINKIEDIEGIKLDLKNGFKLTIVTKEQFESMEYKVD